MSTRKNILITGASSGLGEGMAREFAAMGRNLALCARRTERLDALAAELRAKHPGITVLTRALDVNDHDAVFRVFKEFRAELGGLEQKAGHLVVVSSVSAVRGMGGNITTYAASKAAAAALAEGIRSQHLGGPIEVTTLMPGYIESEMTGKAGKPPLMIDGVKGAKALVKAIERETAKAYVPSWPWSVLAQVMRFGPLSLVRKFG